MVTFDQELENILISEGGSAFYTKEAAEDYLRFFNTMNPSKKRKSKVKKNGDYWQIHHEVVDYSKDPKGETTSEGFKDLAAAALIGASSVLGSAPETQAVSTPQPTQVLSKPNLNKLIDVLCRVESNNNPKAVGDNGKALGILQIWKTYVDDVNRIYKTSYKHDDAFNPNLAKEMAQRYLSFYGRLYEKRTGKPATYEVLAKIHNGGPGGYKNPNTDKYWEKVKALI